jgi:hypothetical protein
MGDGAMVHWLRIAWNDGEMYILQWKRSLVNRTNSENPGIGIGKDGHAAAGTSQTGYEYDVKNIK